MTALETPDDRTESHDSVLFEFTDPSVDFTPRPIRDAVLRQLSGWLRDAVAARAGAKPGDPSALADCLLGQARVLLALQRAVDAVPKLEEAERLYLAAGAPALADCLHVAANVYVAFGEPNKAFEYLRREEELRRRFAA
jgi:hypothetical protein